MADKNNARRPRVNRRSFIKSAGVASVVALAGCSGDGGGNGGSTESLEWNHGKTIHYIGPPTESTWWRLMPAGHAIEAHKNGWEFSFTAPGWDPAEVNDQITNYAQSKDALIVNPVAYQSHIQTIERVQEDFNTPVVGNKDLVGGAVSHNIQSADYELAELMVEDAINFLDEKRGGRQGKTVVHFQGNPDFTGWRRRMEQVRQSMKNYPDVEYVEVTTDGTVSGWADSARTYFANNTADAVISDSSGAYTRGIMDAMAANDMLYYKGHENHIYVGGIDGYPSALQYIRKGLQDLDATQVPINITQNISKIFYDQILDPSVQQPNKEIPQAEVGTEITSVTDPVDVYWGPSESLTLEMADDFDVPIANAPPEVYGIRADNVNEENHWGNVFPAIMERTDIMDVDFDVQGEQPSEYAGLVDEFEENLEAGEYGEKLDYLSEF